MVQIGNEINNGMCDAVKPDAVVQLLKSGSKAVREKSKEYGKDIQIVVHYTNISNSGEVHGLVSNLQDEKLDYDIIGLSFYPFWDGTMDNMKSVVKDIKDNFKKR